MSPYYSLVRLLNFKSKNYRQQLDFQNNSTDHLRVKTGTSDVSATDTALVEHAMVAVVVDSVTTGAATVV